MQVKVRKADGEREGKRESLFSASGLVDVVKLFMHFCDTTLAALGHRGNNNFWTPDHAQEMTAFITHLGQLAARFAPRWFSRGTAGLSKARSHADTMPACMINIITSLCPVASGTQGIIKTLIQCHHTSLAGREIFHNLLSWLRFCFFLLKHWALLTHSTVNHNENQRAVTNLNVESYPSLPKSLLFGFSRDHAIVP